jgi:hypothetical protein
MGTSFPHIDASEYLSTTLKALKLRSMASTWRNSPFSGTAWSRSSTPWPRSRNLSLTCNIHSAKGGPKRLHGQLGS